MKVVHLCFPRPGAHLPNVPMAHMYPTPEPHALDMWSGAMETLVPDLITEPTEFSCGTLLIEMVSIVCMALAAIVTGEPHLRAGPSLFGISMHCHLVQRWPLHQMRWFRTACTALLTNFRTELPEM